MLCDRVSLPKRSGFKHWLSFEADRRWAPPRGRQASADRKQVAGCQETNPWVLLTENTEAESCLLQYLVRQFHLSLAHQLSADLALFKALRSQEVHLHESQWGNFVISLSPSQGPAPWFPYTLCLFFIVALANTKQSWRSVFGKIDGWAPVLSGAMWLNEGILFLWLHTYRALSLLKALKKQFWPWFCLSKML